MKTIDRGHGPLEPLFAFEEDDIEKIADRFSDAIWQRKSSDGFGAGSLSYGKNHPVGRMRDAWRRGDLFERAGDETFNLKNAVGPEAENLPTDVARVQTALGRAGVLDLAETDGPTGMFNGLLGERIEKAQRDGGKKVDAIVTPGGETISMLQEQANGNRQNPVSAPPRQKTGAGNLLAQAQPQARQPLRPMPLTTSEITSLGTNDAKLFIPPPSNKAEFFKGQNGTRWKNWMAKVSRLSNVSEIEALAYASVYGQEGGERPDPDDKDVFAGIRLSTLKELGRLNYIDPKIASKHPKDLSTDERAVAYRAYTNFALNRIGGHKALEEIRHPDVAVVLIDTVFSHGRGAGAAIVQQAIEKVTGNKLQTGYTPDPKNASDTSVGNATFDPLVELSKSWALAKRFLHELGEFRVKENPKWEDRIRHLQIPRIQVDPGNP